jgi:hypothetical protein
VDRVHYSTTSSALDGQGRCQFPALIPGATYRILGTDFKTVKEFTVTPGQKLKLPDLVIGRQL